VQARAGYTTNDRSAGRRVYALEPRGFGDSEKPVGGYDPVTAANDLHPVIESLGLAAGPRVDIVAHDVGTWIAYAHAATFPADVCRVVLTEASIPSVSVSPGGVPDQATNVKTWHFSFNRIDDLPEILVQGRERAFLGWLYANKAVRRWAIGPADLDEYVRVFASPGAARAGFAYYRAFFDDAGLAAARAASARRLPMPVLALGAEGGVGGALLKTLQPLGDNVRGGVLADCGHFLPDECPGEFMRAILDFWQSTDAHPSAMKR
jgi:pimeloyl-ACP methyl ester carboxylesterase